ncbi:HTH-type transcriptional repressor ComR [Zhongshania aliphaticivorans]|uniref:HTH-type transcriptional repressor ComR n=1 Tax=Zhongshania aliphaticivorans TaxID=1470434 RepID=A0A5S9NG48_9GAMM|nr:TetR/AcrR family transcriptional regulator [Zhongshania aliphaticivorans]CAA0088518.1 HTH-type transcriptional repressor ComR [Zhongshania aliphaticivorans]CAA0094555.1 HTH-type transcriptional repressor ComR [Zhongshania aliphaticivorans]
MARPRQQESKQLLDAATQLFWRQGYAATGTREIETALGLKSPAIYHRFGSKHDLFIASLKHYIATVIDWRIKHYLEAEDALKGLQDFFTSIPLSASKYHQPPSCLLVNTTLERAAENPDINTCLHEGTLKVLLGLRNNLKRLQVEKILSPNADIEATADNLQLQLFGLLVSSRLPHEHHALLAKATHITTTLDIKPKNGAQI